MMMIDDARSHHFGRSARRSLGDEAKLLTYEVYVYDATTYLQFSGALSVLQYNTLLGTHVVGATMNKNTQNNNRPASSNN